MEIRDPLFATPDVSLEIGSHFFLLLKLDLGPADVLLQLVQPLLRLLQFVAFGLQLALEFLLLPGLSIKAILIGNYNLIR